MYEHKILVHSKKYLDFGQGFYVTTFENQAKKWVVRKGMRQEKNAIENMDAKYLAEDLIENEPDIFE